MPTELEYMQLATRVYAASPDNTIDLPSEKWNEENWLPDQGFGFSAGVYVNDTTKEIVIAYAGTNETVDALNYIATVGLPAPQIFDAMAYYLNIYATFKAAHPDDYMDYNISFTGHSLGGGLASLMAVYFDQKATVFDQMPTELSALSTTVKDAVARLMDLSGYSDEKFTAYLESPISSVFARESNVTHYYIDGEFLNAVRIALPTLVGSDTPLFMGNSAFGPVERHSIALMLAWWASPAFRTAVQTLPDLVTLMSDENLYSAKKESATEDFLLKLIRHQFGVSGAIIPDAMLTRFGEDMQKIAQSGGLTMSNADLTKALTAFAMQMYYEDTNPNSTDRTKELFDYDGVTGGIHFKSTDVTAVIATVKGYSYFLNYLNSLPETDMDYAVVQVIKQKMSNLLDWYIQAGTSPMNATAGDQPAFMLGGSGGDNLTGGSSNDVLIGGQGIDYLNGGGGVDIMLGGAGNDTYYVDKAGDYAYEREYEGKDTVISTVTYHLPDYVENLTLEGTASINGTGNALNNVIIGNSGNNTIYGGAGNDTIQGGNGVNTLFGEAGNDFITGGKDTDNIFGGSGNDHIIGGNGGNTLFGDDGNDFIVGGKDNDGISGGKGDDVIYAGGGINSLRDESGNDQYMLVKSGKDTISDADGEGGVYLDGGKLTGGWKVAECEYKDAAGNTYIWSGVEGTNLIINRNKIVTNFHNEERDLGIYLFEKKETPPPGGGGSSSSGGAPGFGGASSATVPCDPLLIDLNGDGIQTVASTQGIFFDYDGNGFAERMGWASSDDGVLVLDRNLDGIINDGSELFGDQTILSTGLKAANGFQALADLDSNHDGRIDINDAAYSNLRIWRDIDSDGYSQTSELFTLDELGVKSISLTSTATNLTDASGNTQTLIGSFEKTDSTTGQIANYNLHRDTGYTIPVEWVDVPEDIAALPDLVGYGNVTNLQQAMAMDATGELKALIEQFISEENPANRKNIMEQILFHWSDSEEITAKRGNMDGRQLAALEKFVGEDFIKQKNKFEYHGYKPQSKLLWDLYPPLRGIVQLANSATLSELEFHNKNTWHQDTQNENFRRAA